MIIAIDFDGTIVEDNKYPCIKYKFKEYAKEAINNIAKKHNLILCTARYGWYILPAIWFIRKNKLPIKIYKGKPYADIYIDDKNLGCKDINWKNIEKELLNE